jgi:putative glycosyltransferase (TIGR04348 family)
MQEANNGNWHTAHRWATFLADYGDIAVLPQWPAAQVSKGERAPQLMIALHARRSAASIAAWADAYPDKPLIVVLTGTDLYRDIQHDTSAKKSLALASRLVVLQQDGLEVLPEPWHAKTSFIYQSAATLKPAVQSQKTFSALMVGHLREEKDPLTFMRAARRLSAEKLRFEQIGMALTPAYEQAAQDTTRAAPHYRWLGGLSRALTRQRIKRAHVLVNCSTMEGGAQVILEAVQSGTPVLASRVSGNIGMLGADYAGYFALGDDAQLAALLRRCAAEPDFLARLQGQCALRAPLFAPQAEKQHVLNLVASELSRTAPAQRNLKEHP